MWDTLDTTYRMSNTQMAIDVQQEREGLTVSSKDEWEAHVENLHELMGLRASYDKLLSPEEKVSKLKRTLPKRYAPIEMVAQSDVKFTIKKVTAAGKAEISRCKSQYKK